MVDETGRILREDKRGVVSQKAAHIIARLHISSESWLKLTKNFEGVFTGTIGTADTCVNLVNMWV